VPSVNNGQDSTAQDNKPRKNHRGWWFLLAVVVLHIGVNQINPALSTQSLGYFLKVINKLIPALVLMFILLWLFNLFIKPKQIKTWLGKQSGYKGWVFSILAGIISMGPMYLWYPLLGDLKKQGMQTSLLTAFLYSRAIKIPMLPFMVYYFGSLYTALFLINVIIFSFLSGIIMERICPTSQ
jgi:uncharacterized membrane protein YraQ (UPF0718 family)